jgi:hypothetical protein
MVVRAVLTMLALDRTAPVVAEEVVADPVLTLSAVVEAVV